MIASEKGRLDIVKFLVDFGTDVAANDENEVTH